MRKEPTNGQEWEKNKVGTRTAKWDKNRNKVGTKWESNPTWDKNGNKVGTKWFTLEFLFHFFPFLSHFRVLVPILFKVGQEREQSGKWEQSGTRMGTK